MDKIKWDFYKKNIDAYFSINGEIIPFYNTNLNIEEDKKLHNIGNCYFGTFSVLDYSTITNRDSIYGAPIVHTICYSKDYRRIIGFYSGHSLFIDSLIKNIEVDETLRLEKISRTEKVCDFIRSYKRN